MKRLMILLLFALPVAAQTNVRWDLQATTTTGTGQMVPVLALPGALINFYTGCTALPCLTPATTYTAITGATACPSNAQVVWQPSLGCKATADSQGSFGAYLQAGNYQYTITVSGTVNGPYNFSIGGTGGGGGGSPFPPQYSVQAANPPLSGFISDPGIIIDTTAHSFTSPILNGSTFAKSYQTGGGNNGIANATINAQNQVIVADPSYSATEQYSFSSPPQNVPPQYHLLDLRQGAQADFFHSWQQPSASLLNFGNNGAAKTTNCLWDGTPLFAGDFMHHDCSDLEYITTEPGLSFGNEYSPDFNAPLWRIARISNYSMQSHGSGITQTTTFQNNNWGVGDTMSSYFYMFCAGGTTAASDEGCKAFGINASENQSVFEATCTSGCTTGSTIIHSTVTVAAQGTNRYLIDKNQGTSTTTSAMAASGLGFSTAVTVAATVPVSNAWGTLPVACGPHLGPLNLRPPFSASFSCVVNVISGTFDTTHLVCFGAEFHECSIPTAVSSVSGGLQTITLPVRKPHGGNATDLVFQGGLAGYGIEFSAFNQTVGGVLFRYPMDVIGSTDSHTAIAIAFQKGSYIGIANFGPLNNTFLYGTFALTALTSSGSTVSGTSASSVTVSNPSGFNGATFTISGASDAAFNHACTNFQWSSPNIFTCTIASIGTHSAASATASFNNNSIVLWPMAEVIDVQNEAPTPPVMDGTLALEPNIIPLATNDPLEEPDHYISEIQEQTGSVFAWNPWNKDSAALTVEWGGAGYSGGNNDEGILMRNATTPAYFLGLGGIITPPLDIHVNGPNSGFLFADYAPSPGASVLGIGIQAAQKTDQLFAYNFFSLAADGAFQGCNANFVPFTNTLSFPGCASIVFPQGPGQVTLPSINLTTTADFQSAIGYNYAPYSNAFSTAGSSGVWQVTGGTGTVTCSITDDFGDPACTLVDTSGSLNFNWAASNTAGYTPLPASTAFTVQVRAMGAVGGEIIGLQAGLQGAAVTLTTTWTDYCVPITTSSSFLGVLAQINVEPSETVMVSNVTVRPGPGCGPPLLTTGAGGSAGAQFTTPTPVNNAGTLNIGTLTLPNISGSTQCLQASSTGVVSGTGSTCGSGGGTTSTICSGTLTLSGTINTLTAGSAGTATCTGLASTDAIIGSFNGTPFGITGFAPSATGILTCALVPSTNTITAYCSNNTSSNITIGASAVINYRVVR